MPRAFPDKRYYGGCEVVDQVEQLAIDRLKELFGADMGQCTAPFRRTGQRRRYAGLPEARRYYSGL